MIQIKSFTFNILGTNCHVIWDDSLKSCIVSDPGMHRETEFKTLDDFLAREGLSPEAILLTHGHFDHVYGVAGMVSRYGCPVYMSEADEGTVRLGVGIFEGHGIERMGIKIEVKPFAFTPVEDGQILHLGGLDWKAIATPGHSPGSVCYYCESGKLLLSGDTLMAGTIGRSDCKGGDYDVLMKSLLEKVMTLPGDVEVLPGHGEATSIAREAASNPFLIPFNEADTDWWEQDGLPLQRD